MEKWGSKRRNRLFAGENGFTLTEILITIVILGILAAIAVPIYNAQRKKSDDFLLKSNLIASASNIEQAKVAFGGKYPATVVPTGKPAIITATDDGVAFEYSIPYDRLNYCLQGTYKGKQLFISHTTQTPTVDDCTYTYVTPAPANFSAQVDLTFKPTARWDAVDDATAYNVYKDGIKVATFTKNNGVLPAMTPASTAVYWVRAVVGGVETDDSNKVSLTAPVPPPATAPTLSYTQTADNGAVMTTTNALSWTAVTNATSYLVYDADTNILLFGGSSTTFSVTIEKESSQRFYVIASNESGNGPKSNIVTIAPKFATPKLVGTVDDFTLKANFSWQGMPATYGTGSTAKLFITDNSFTSATLTGNTYTTTHDRATDIWKLRVTTGNGTVIDSNVVTLAPKAIPVVNVIHQQTYQNLDRTFTNTPSYYGLNSSNSSWKVEVSDTSAFTKIYPQSSETGTDPDETFSGMVAPTHGDTYYVRYVVTRNSDGASLVSQTKSLTIPTRSMDINNNGNRDVLALYTWNGNQKIFIIPTNTNGVGMNPGSAVVDPRLIGQDCTVYPVMDFTKPGSQGFICWRHNTLIGGYPGSLDYYEFQANGTIGTPLLLGTGWNMYEKMTVIQNFYGDDYPSIMASRPDGGLEIWRGGPGGLKSVDRNSGNGWHLAGSDTSSFKGVYDWNGYGSVGVMATLRYAPFQRYYPLKKIPTAAANTQFGTYINQNASWTAIAGPSGFFPTDTNSGGCCSYIYSRGYGNMVSGGKTLPVVGFGPKTYFDAFWGNGTGSFAGIGTNWGFPNEGYMGYPEEWKTIR